ncbi:LysR family transcriptional regulator [Mitsuaria sp. 7]|uniref:LysR family transcriptional regulator n=1 Tax=Mitsuaria sp. 7 TaxID=1658665 RepID=UPI0007DD5738|nr:LysR family transcriptional regulator [Mitsuaria sp. 7]ANH69159.1 LysR family transcriptional regulator [Mitsuaria sp. 7]
MNLASVDLNLLVAFEALYDTRSVSLAGQRLHRAQPSVSNALSRLRHLFGDALFVRSAQGMLPTARADALRPIVGAALAQIRAALTSAGDFDPAQASDRRFTIAASDYVDIVLLPSLMALLRSQAPGLSLRFTALDRASIYAQLDQGEVDLAIGGHLAPPKRMTSEHLYDEDFVCVTDRSRAPKRRRTMSLDVYVDLPHALFVPSDDGSTRGVIDAALNRLGRRRRVVATFAHVAALPRVVQGTDLVATLARRVAERLAPPGVALQELPAELDATAFPIHLVSGSRTQTDPAGLWLCGLVKEAVTTMLADQ